MRFFRFVLILTCTLSIAWSALFLIAPFGVQWFIKFYSKGTIIPYNLSVTPTLDIKIGSISFSKRDNNGSPIFLGSSRAISIKWSIFSDKPFLTVQAGPTVFERVANFGKIHFYTPSWTNLEFGKLPFVVEASPVSAKNFGDATKVKIDGILTNGFRQIDQINFNLSQLAADKIIINSVESLSGTLSKIDLDRKIIEQTITGVVFGTELRLNELGLISSKAQIDFKTVNGTTQFNSFLNEIILFDSMEGYIEQANFSGAINDGILVDQAQLDIEGGSFYGNSLEVKKAAAKINFSEVNNYFASVEGELGKIDLYSGTTYLGKLPGGSFSIDGKLYGGSAKVHSEIYLDTLDKASIGGSGDITAKLEKWSDVYECAKLKCQLSELQLDYSIKVGRERIDIASRCSKNPCALNDLRYLIKTTHTGEIFKILSSVNFLNPIVLAYLYASVNAGEAIGNGHVIKM